MKDIKLKVFEYSTPGSTTKARLYLTNSKKSTFKPDDRVKIELIDLDTILIKKSSEGLLFRSKHFKAPEEHLLTVGSEYELTYMDEDEMEFELIDDK